MAHKLNMTATKKMRKSERERGRKGEMQYLSILDKLCPEIIVILGKDVFKRCKKELKH